MMQTQSSSQPSPLLGDASVPNNELYQVCEEGDMPTYKLSVTFNHNLLDAEGHVPESVLITYDGVYFAVSASRLRAVSSNDFGRLLSFPSESLSASSPSSSIVAVVPLASAVLNILLHAAYDLSVLGYAPSLEDLGAAVEALESFGLSKETNMNPTSPLFRAILYRAPSIPLECYKLAAHAQIEELAVAISPYTLCLSLTDLTDEDVVQMGTHYARRLFFLHLGRIDALKRLLLPPPDVHLASLSCDTISLRQVGRAWIITVAELIWDLSPGTSLVTLDTRLRTSGHGITCNACIEQLDHRIKQLLLDWSLVKQTI